MTARVLIVDSDFTEMSALEADLTARGYEVCITTTAFDALLLCCQGKVDVVLVDAAQTGLDGFELCRILKNDPTLASLPVIMMTGHDRLDHNLRAFDNGADEILPVPARSELVVRRIESTLAVRELHDSISRLGGDTDTLNAPLKVLLIDSNPASCSRLEEILSAECNVVTVSEGDPGASFSLMGEFDLVIREENTVSEETQLAPWDIHGLYRPSPSVLLLLDEGLIESETGIDDVLHRPVRRTEVLTRVRLAGRKQRLKHTLRTCQTSLRPTQEQAAPQTRQGTYLRAAA